MGVKTEEIGDVQTKTRDEKAPPWNVVVFDDPVNLMSFVTLVFRRVFGYSEEKATTLMLEVHHQGESVVWSGEKEKAEFYVQQLQSFQLLAAMKKA